MVEQEVGDVVFRGPGQLYLEGLGHPDSLGLEGYSLRLGTTPVPLGSPCLQKTWNEVGGQQRYQKQSVTC